MAMHEGQVHIDEGIARRLVGDNFPEFRFQPVTAVVSSGTVNAIYRVGNDATARFLLQENEPAIVAAALRAEANATSEFAEWCPFPTPRPLGLGQPGWSYPMPWSMHTWVSGDVATPTGLAASETCAGDLATLLESMRRAETHGRLFDGKGRGGEITDQDVWVTKCFAHSTELLDVKELRTIWRALRALPAADETVMSHKDLTPPNILVTGERIVGILDAGGFGPADPALDLVAVWHLFDRDARDLVRQRLRPSKEEWLRGASWAFAQAMGLVWYYRHTNPGMSALGRSTLQRLTHDPEVPR